MKKQLADGFTLIELMIVIVIVSILAGIAYPAYVDQVRKGRRADCAGVLTGLAAAMERKFTENNSYKGLANGGANSGAPDASVYPAKCPISGSAIYYNLNIENTITDTTYEIRANPVSGSDQDKDRCGSLTLTNTGVKGLYGNDAGTTVDRCW